jgi:hypothetical protein
MAKQAIGKRKRTIVRPAEADDFINELELSAWLRKDQRTVQRWRDSGTGPPFIRNGPRHILYRVSDVQHWLTEQTFRHRAEEIARRQPR